MGGCEDFGGDSEDGFSLTVHSPTSRLRREVPKHFVQDPDHKSVGGPFGIYRVGFDSIGVASLARVLTSRACFVVSFTVILNLNQSFETFKPADQSTDLEDFGRDRMKA